MHARESVLKQDLTAIRNAIDAYTLDKQKAPQSLQDLVSANYLKEIPEDPMGEKYTVDEASTEKIAERLPFPEAAAKSLAFNLSVHDNDLGRHSP